MENLIVQISHLPVSSEDIIILTFGTNYSFDELNDIMKNLESRFPQYNFVANLEGLIKNITVLKHDEPLKMIFDKEAQYDNLY